MDFIDNLDLDLTNAEQTAYDSNNDGVTDFIVTEAENAQIVERDYDQDGIIDHVEVFVDNTGDGKIDMVVQATDYNKDGEMDHSETFLDKDGDQQQDVVIIEELTDSDGDGVNDDINHEVRVLRDDLQQAALRFNPKTGVIEPVTIMLTETEQLNVEGLSVDELENFDPSKCDPDQVVGNPVEDMERWKYQGEDGPCALYSQMFAIEQITGQDIDINEFINTATEQGIFHPEGTAALDMNKMLDYCGIDNEMTFNNDTQDIVDALSAGDKVIVSIDANQIWYGRNHNIFNPQEMPNHAVEVIGIDYTNADQPMVILNDPGNPDGRGVMVPLNTFDNAWESGDRQMIVCNA